MHVKVAKNFLSTAVHRLQGTVSDRSLAQIGLRATSDGLLKVSATDHVLAVFSTLNGEILTEGTAFVPGRLFSDVVRELPEGVVTLKQTKTQLEITAGKDQEFLMRLPLIEDGVWKEPAAIDGRNVAELPTDRLSYMIEQVQFCVAQESSRNYGSVGFLHRPTNGALRLVGTDGFRLSFCDLADVGGEAFLKEGICLSKRALTELHRMCQEGFENLRLAISEDGTTLMAAVPDYQIFIRLSAVKYPNYQGVLPTANLNPVKVSRPHLQSVTKRVLLASDKTRSLQLRFTETSLLLSSKSVANSESRESVTLNGYRGTQRDLSVNGKFLVDVFAVIAGDELTLQFKSEEDPIVIVPQDEPKSCRSMHVLVPIRDQ